MQCYSRSCIAAQNLVNIFINSGRNPKSKKQNAKKAIETTKDKQIKVFSNSFCISALSSIHKSVQCRNLYLCGLRLTDILDLVTFENKCFVDRFAEHEANKA